MKFLNRVAFSVINTPAIKNLFQGKVSQELTEPISNALRLITLSSQNQDRDSHLIQEQRKLTNKILHKYQELPQLKNTGKFFENFFDLLDDLLKMEAANYPMIPDAYILQRLQQGKDISSHAAYAKKESTKAFLEGIDNKEQILFSQPIASHVKIPSWKKSRNIAI